MYILGIAYAIVWGEGGEASRMALRILTKVGMPSQRCGMHKVLLIEDSSFDGSGCR